MKKSDKGPVAIAQIDLEVGRRLFRDTLTIELSSERRRVRLRSVVDVLGRLKAFIQRVYDDVESMPLYMEQDGALDTLKPDSYESANLLMPKVLTDVDGVVPRFTSDVSISKFDCNILDRPFGVLAAEYRDPMAGVSRVYLFVTDANWDRIIASEGCDEWITSYGTYGHDPGQFAGPAAVAFVPWLWLVADAYNNRAQLFSMSYDNSLSFRKSLEGNFVRVWDVAAADFGDLTGKFAILSQGTNKVTIYNRDGLYMRTLFPYGGPNNATSVSFARHPLSGNELDYLYVADNGNKRVIRASANDPFAPYKTTPSETFPDDAYLSSVDVDTYGYPYVLDNRNGRVYKLSPGLSEIVAEFGSKGTGP